ncbi:VCBS repeat-containing protein [Aureitalea marina]|uniref:RNA-binding protein n=1 Tax=Aureitalea marina TaxID=930804 RepID=A0A2S7KMV4_9FLAO|nr:VCBS repeat-containing protein [Aureitalea marina]PQB03928.1 RNA-binding protein [Aureitalea marina]
MNSFRISLLLITFFVLTACQQEEAKQEEQAVDPLFTELDPADSGMAFINTVENQKDFNIFKYRNFYNGGGVAIGDINNDGLPDIYMTANMGKNKLFLNKGDFKFEDISASAGIEGNKPWSTGVAMVDINADGLLDIYVSNAGNMEGDNHNNDLYINNGDLTFTEQAEAYNLAETGFTTHATFFDYDKDGDLDAYILNNSNIPVSSLGYAEQRNVRAQDWNVPKMFRGVGDMLLRNDGGVFTEVSEEAGIYGSLIGFGLGVMISDVNNDLYPDIYVSNDFYERDYLYINNQDGTFTEDIKNWTSRLCLSAMGIDMADINNDGNADIFITDMLPDGDQRVKSVMEFEGYNVFKLKQSKDFYQQYIQNTLQLNNGNGSYSEIAYFSGVSATDWSWSGLMFDMDNDGYRDIFVTNGVNHDLTDLDFVDFFANEIIQEMALTGKKEAIDSIIAKMPIVPVPNYAYHNNKDLTFTNRAVEWGLGEPGLSNGAAYGDLDNDGDLDLVVNNVNMQASLYRNNSLENLDNHYLRIQLKGKEANTFAIGSTIKAYANGQVYMQELIPSRGFQSSMDYTVSLGLGQATQVDSLRVIWPDDKTTVLGAIPVDQTVNLNWADANEAYSPAENKAKPLMREMPNDLLVKHEENNYSDFDFEGLIAKMLSQEGPCMAVGDLNGDGNEDVFIGGANGQAGSLNFHSGNGSLRPVSSQTLEDDKQFEDTAAAIFDADKDGDMDLVVGSGGNQVDQDSGETLRLYLNDGQGNLTKAPLVLPPNIRNVSAIAVHDLDGDGDQDIFVAARSIIGIYGVDPEHLYLENLGDGQFINKSSEVIQATRDSGMLTDATWSDLDGDGQSELITVTDWGSPRVYKVQNGKLEKMTSGLDSYEGWWGVVKAVDIDQDGDQDLLLGNEGKNIHYQPSEENIIKIWVSDFDNNGTIEQIMTQTIDGRDMPLHQKKEIVAQLVSLKKQNLKASEYARRSIQELFPPEVLNRARVRSVNTSASMLAVNDGNGNFDVRELPTMAQLSCVCGISCTDVNNDGHLDIVMGGNNYEFKPQYSRLDSNYGSVLLNDGSLNFDWQNYTESGFYVRNEIKHIEPFSDNTGKTFLLVAINDERPKVFALNE